MKNPESGRCRRGKPTQRSPGLDTPKGTEPHGRSRPYPTLRVLHPRTTSSEVERRWETALGTTARKPHRFGEVTSRSNPRRYPGERVRPRSCPSKGTLRGDCSGFGRTHRLEDAPIPSFGSGCGEARRELPACTQSPVTARQNGRGLRPATGPAQSHTGGRGPNRTEASATVRLSAGNPASGNPASPPARGLPPNGNEGSATFSRGWGQTTGSADQQCNVLGDFAPHRNRVDELFGERRLAAAVIL